MSRVELSSPAHAAMIKRLKKLQGKIENPGPILEEVGDVLRKTTISRFYLADIPDGTPVEAVEGGQEESGG